MQPDGILGGAALSAALRSQMVTTMQPFTAAPQALWGIPILTSTYWNDATGVALVGGFQACVVGIRRAITYTVSQEGVITDALGKVVYNALQQDGVIVRAYLRIALQVVQPIGNAGTAVPPLALATSTGPVAAAAATKAAKA